MTLRKVTWRILCLACVVSLASAALAAKTNEPTLLRFKFVKDHVDKLALEMTGDGQMSIIGAPRAGNIDSPVTLSVSLPLDFITDSVDPNGNGHLSVGLGIMVMQTSFAGQDMRMTMDPDKGTMTMSLNGNVIPFPAPAMGQALAKLVLVLSPQGQVVDVQGLDRLRGLTGMGAMAGAGMGGMNQDTMLAMLKAQQPGLPEQPVKVGDSWQRTVPIPLPQAPVPEGTPAPPPPQITTIYTLDALQTIAGHPMAQIGVSGHLELKNLTLPAAPAADAGAQGAAGTPPGAPSGNTLDLMTMDITGEMTVPLDGGYLHGGHLEVTLNLETSMALPAAAGGGTMQMKMDDLKLVYDLTSRDEG